MEIGSSEYHKGAPRHAGRRIDWLGIVSARSLEGIQPAQRLTWRTSIAAFTAERSLQIWRSPTVFTKSAPPRVLKRPNVT